MRQCADGAPSRRARGGFALACALAVVTLCSHATSASASKDFGDWSHFGGDRSDGDLLRKSRRPIVEQIVFPRFNLTDDANATSDDADAEEAPADERAALRDDESHREHMRYEHMKRLHRIREHHRVGNAKEEVQRRDAVGDAEVSEVRRLQHQPPVHRRNEKGEVQSRKLQ